MGLRNIFLLFVLLSTFNNYSQTYFDKTYGFPQPYADAVYCPIIEVYGEGYIFPYYSWNYSNGDSRIIVQKINYQGDTMWRKSYGETGVAFEPHYIIKSNDGNYVVAGYFATLIDTASSFYLLKIKPNGDSLWSRKYPPITKARVVNANMVKQTGDKGYILCGARQPYTSTGNALAADIYVVKTDSLGNMQWNKQFGGSGHDVATSVIETADKGFLVGGYTSGFGGANMDIYILKMDSVGKFEWDTIYDYGYDEASTGMIQLKDGNYLFAAESTNNSSAPVSGAGVLLKVTPTGSLIWKKKYSGPEITSLNKVLELPNGDIVATGGNNNTPKYNQAGWIMKANANGDSLWARIIDKTPGWTNLFYGITSTQDNGFVLSGFAQIADSVNSYYSANAWIVKVDSMGCDVAGCQFVGIKEQQQLNGSINVFPNPSNGSFMVKSEMLLKKCVVVDILGNIVYSEDNIQLSSISISLSHLSNGIYFLKVADVHDKEQVQKVLIEH